MKMNRFGSKFDYRIVLFLIPFVIILGLSRHRKTAADAPRKVFMFRTDIITKNSSYSILSGVIKTHKVISSKRLYATYRNIIR